MARNTVPKTAVPPKLGCGLPDLRIGVQPVANYYLKKIRIPAKRNLVANTYIQTVSPDGKVLNIC